MQCQTCGNPLDQGAAFCGNCGAINVGQQALLILPGNQAGHTAPTVVSSGLDLQSAITSDDNPYHSLVTNLKMPSLIRNDDHKRMWQEEKTATRRAWYTNNVFYVKDTGSTNVSVDLAQSVVLDNFTLQSLITFHQQQTIAKGVVNFVLAPPSGTPGI